MQHSPKVAYFSMEVGLESSLPTYSGGLGVLAGDTLKAAADLGEPVVGVTLLHRQGYFHQSLDEAGRQVESAVRWDPRDFLRPVPARASVTVAGREVHLRAWVYEVHGARGHVVPVLMLDSDLDSNHPADRPLTGALYGGDHRWRLAQEIVLGIGGIRILRSFGLRDLACYHMNEGHASLLTAELLREESLHLGVGIDSPDAARLVRERCVFTTHTPIAAGHDRFDLDLVRDVVGPSQVLARSPFFIHHEHLDTTRTALALSRAANAVSVRHAEVSRHMFPGAEIAAITNGVHPATWASPWMAALFDRAAPGWRGDGELLERAAALSDADLLGAHARAKRAMIRRINRETNAGLSEGVLTLGIARRCTPYKRLDLVLSDMGALERAAHAAGGLQLIFSGKAHPRDGGGKAMIERLNAAAHRSSDLIRICFVPGYDMDLSAALVSGCDVWVNVPLRTLEASGTSGMKAAVNGVPSLSVPDGWWLEGRREGETGWSVGEDRAPGDAGEEWERDARSFYDVLEKFVAPLYRFDRPGWARVMRGAISLNGSRFSTHRMVRDYAREAWKLGALAPQPV
ncbi:MAG: alpha-glucan family phosphorylase [Planctomycetota bacterium]|nr:alpha-glucan family phosphorylase [Planctomycetota bacterium]